MSKELTTKTGKIISILEKELPEPKTTLNYRTPFQLLVATILSAQSTDKQVNRVTEKLFEKFPGPKEMACLKPSQLEPYIKSLGLYRNKSKYIVETSRIILRKYGGHVPCDLQKLMELPGVGRKTASVVLANAFNYPAFPVDTHVFRVARRLGLSTGKNPFQVEKDLMSIVPQKDWKNFHHWLIDIGRKYCKAQSPLCNKCILKDFCPNIQETKGR